MTVDNGALDLLASLILDDDRAWGDAATPWQWDLARWMLDPKSRPNRWESRPRGGSKTTDVAALLIVLLVLVLPAGSTCLAYARDLAQAARLRDFLLGFVHRTPGLASVLTVDKYVVTSASGSSLTIESGDAASAYGAKASVVVVDELAQWPGTQNTKDLWAAITSGMGKVKGAKLVVITTSGDPGSFAHGVYRHAKGSRRWTVQDVPGPLDWAAPEFLADEQAAQPESIYRRMHLNEWAAPEDRLTNIDDVRMCVTLPGPLDYVAGRRYFIGVDLGVTNDRSVAAVMHAERGRVGGDEDEGPQVVQRLCLDRMQVWTPTKGHSVDLTAVEEWLVFAARQYHAQVICDPYQAIAMIQRLRNQGIRVEDFTFSQASIGRLATALHTTIRDHRLAIPDDEDLIDELVNLRLVETSPNVYRMDHTASGHDDRCIAMSLAILSLTKQGGGGNGTIVTWSDEEYAHLQHLAAKATGSVTLPDPAPPGHLVWGDWSWGLEEDDDGPPPGATARSPWA